MVVLSEQSYGNDVARAEGSGGAGGGLGRECEASTCRLFATLQHRASNGAGKLAGQEPRAVVCAVKNHRELC